MYATSLFVQLGLADCQVGGRTMTVNSLGLDWGSLPSLFHLGNVLLVVGTGRGAVSGHCERIL